MYLKQLFYTAVCLFSTVASVKTVSSPELRPCIECIGYAAATCYNLTKFAQQTISFQYWLDGGAYEINDTDEPGSRTAYDNCLDNEICILNTITTYTSGVLKRINDINCDGEIDCRDRFAVHLFGMQAKEMQNKFTMPQRKRFDRCRFKLNLNLTEPEWSPMTCISPK